jgi:ribosome-binding factor A
MGDDTQQKLCLHGLRSSAGFLQSKISDRIDTRYTPRLRFEIDEGVKKSLAISQMLQELLPGDADTESEPAEDDAESPNPDDQRTEE